MRQSCSRSLALASLLLAGEAAASGFLATGPGARAAAMGGAFTGLADDSSAIFYNPAGLAGQRGAVMAEHVPVNESGSGFSFGDGRLDFLGLQYPTKIGSFGFGVYQFAIGGIEGRQNLSDTATTLNVSQTAYFVPYGVKLGPLSLGATGKIVKYDLGPYSASGYGADAGAKLDLFKQDTFLGRDTQGSFGVAIRNMVAPTLTLYQDPTAIEKVSAVGASVTSKVREGYEASADTIVHDRLTFSVDFSKGNIDTPLSFAAGVEYCYLERFALRGGFTSGGNITVGLGLGGPASSFRFDYAAGLVALAPEHHFSLSWLFTDPSTPVESAVHLSEFRRAVLDQERLKERFVREGRNAASQGQYDDAVADFTKAAVLDPSDEEVRGLVASSAEGSRLAGVKVRIDAARREFNVGHYDLASKNMIDAVSFDPASQDAAHYADELRNVLISTGAVASFDMERAQVLEDDAKKFEIAFMDHNIGEVRRIVARVKAVHPDDMAVWKPLADRLAAATKEWCADLAAQAARAETTKDVLGMARALRRIRRVDASYAGLQELTKRLKKLSRGGSSSFYNKNYLRQLYDTAAADYVLGNFEAASRHLSVLLNENALHEAGNALIDRMRDESGLSDAQEP